MSNRIRFIFVVLSPLALVAGCGGCGPHVAAPPPNPAPPKPPPIPLLSPAERVTGAALSGEGQLLAAFDVEPYHERPSVPRGLVLWDARSGKKLWMRTQPEIGGRAFCFAFFPGGKKIVVNVEHRLAVLDARDGKELRDLGEQPASMLSLAVSPDGKAILVGGSDVDVRLLDVADGSLIRSMRSGGDAHSVAISPDGRQGLSLGRQPFGSCCLWDLGEGELIRRFRAADGWQGSEGMAAFSPDGKYAVLQRYDSQAEQCAIVLIETQEGQPVRSPPDPEFTAALAFTADGKRLLCASVHDQSLALRDAESGDETWKVKIAARNVVAVSPDGRLAFSASGHDDASGGLVLNVYDGATGKLLRQLDSGGVK